MRQSALTIVAPVEPETDVKALKVSLQRDGGGWQARPEGPFAALETLHYLSCCVVESEGLEPPLVVLELNFDGRAEAFLAQLVATCRTEIDRIFGSCTGYPRPAAPPGRIAEFLRRHHRRAQLFYLGHPGRSVKQILEEDTSQRGLRDELRGRTWATRAEAWGRLRPPKGAPKPPRLPFLVRYSLNGGRGPKRGLALLRLALRSSLLLVGVAAFCGFVAFAAWTGNGPALGAAVGTASIAPLLVGSCFLWLRPRHLTRRGSWLVARGALREAARAFAYSAALVGLAVALLPDVSARWLPFPVWEFLGAAARWAIGLGVWLAALVAITVVMGVLTGWISGFLTGAVVIGMVAYAGYLSPGLAGIFELVGGAVAAALGSALLVAAAVVYLPRLRRREAEDAVAPAHWDIEHLARMTQHEDRRFQNHFASVTHVKDGRLSQLRWVLRLIHLLGKVYFNQGDLGSIPSIHFARFVILEGGKGRKRLLFLTNYDGGWPNYLGEFSHVAGVTLVWGNTELFPRPFLIGGDGARDEQRFKTWARDSQVETLIWYSAYPDLSVVEVNRNTRVRESLARPLEKEVPGFAPLRPFWRHFGRPLDEAALDEALRSLTH